MVPCPWRNSARSPNNPNPFRCTARRCNKRLFPRRRKNIYAERPRGHENTIRWDTNCAFAVVVRVVVGFFFPLLYICFQSSWAKFFIICFCGSRAEFAENSITAVTEKGKSQRDARPHPRGPNPGAAATRTGSRLFGCNFTPRHPSLARCKHTRHGK